MANELSNLKPPAGSQRPRTRLGRGEGSGKGKTAGRGSKVRPTAKGGRGFEGGQRLGPPIAEARFQQHLESVTPSFASTIAARFRRGGGR